MRSSSRLRLALSTSSKSLYRILHLSKYNSVAGVHSPHPTRNYTTSKCLSTTTTYYDSQSGLHLPIHNQQEIRLFLDVNYSSNTSIPFEIPQQLSKHRDEADEMSDKLKQLTGMGIHGVILPPFKFPRDYRNFQTLVSIAPPNFYFICSTDDDGAILKAQDYSSSTNLSKVFQYNNNNNSDKDDENRSHDSFRNSIENGLHTTLSITKDIYVGDTSGDNVVEPITLANNIASMIDAVGGCNFIWLSSKISIKDDDDNNDECSKEETTIVSETTIPSSPTTLVADTMIQICEELIYLDVAGATIKSRLLVDSLNEDIIEDTMFAGVNSYVIDNEEQVEMVDNVAKEQSKSISRS
jgi:hypothetical protein